MHKLSASFAILALVGASTSAGAPKPPPLQAEAAAAAAGDIPDNQVFIVYRNTREGYSLKFPEGWARSGSGAAVTIRDKNNVIRVLVEQRREPSAALARSEILGTKGAHLTNAPAQVTLGRSHLLKLSYTTVSAPNPVTGKRVTLVVDRYYIPHGSTTAVLDLGTPQGVDNVDAYRLIAGSFKWR